MFALRMAVLSIVLMSSVGLQYVPFFSNMTGKDWVACQWEAGHSVMRGKGSELFSSPREKFSIHTHPVAYAPSSLSPAAGICVCVCT